MAFSRRLQGLLFVLISWQSSNAIAGWSGTAHISPSTSNRMYRCKQPQPRATKGAQGLTRSLSSSRGPTWLTMASRRSPAAAVPSSTSQLITGRTPSGLLENCIEACLNTLGSFVGGAITGCFIGAFMGGTFGRVPDVGVLKSVQIKAGQMGGDWGKLTAAFSGFTSVSTIVRGKNDKWDQVVGAAGAGAFLNRAKGPSAMAQGAATYGLFSLVFASQSREDELDVVDVPVDNPQKR